MPNSARYQRLVRQKNLESTDPNVKYFLEVTDDSALDQVIQALGDITISKLKNEVLTCGMPSKMPSKRSTDDLLSSDISEPTIKRGRSGTFNN